MILPALFAILSPITVGFLIGGRCLTGFLGGSIASGMMLALMMANAGGAWVREIYNFMYLNFVIIVLANQSFPRYVFHWRLIFLILISFRYHFFAFCCCCCSMENRIIPKRYVSLLKHLYNHPHIIILNFSFLLQKQVTHFHVSPFFLSLFLHTKK